MCGSFFANLCEFCTHKLILKGDALLVIEKGEEEEEEDAADEEVRESEGKVGAEPPEETPSEEKVGAELLEETPNEGNDKAMEAKEVTPKEGNVPKNGALDGRADVPKMEGAEELDVTAAAKELETLNPKSDGAEPEPRLGALTLMDVANDNKEGDAGNSPSDNDDVDVVTEEPREKDDNPNPPLFADVVRILFGLCKFCANCAICAKSCFNFRTQKEHNKEQGPVRFICANFLFVLKEQNRTTMSTWQPMRTPYGTRVSVYIHASLIS